MIPFGVKRNKNVLFSVYNSTMKQQQDAFLTRDIIGMIRECKDDANVLRYLESFSSSIAQIIDSHDTVNWYDIAGICDQRYYSIRQGKPIELNTELLDQCKRAISVYLPPRAA